MTLGSYQLDICTYDTLLNLYAASTPSVPEHLRAQHLGSTHDYVYGEHDLDAPWTHIALLLLIPRRV